MPEDVRNLFAVARGTMLYGWFSIRSVPSAKSSLRRVADMACARRYRALGGSLNKNGEVPSFARRIKFLVGAGVIPAECEELWDGFRVLRNIGSHPVFQTLQPPGQTLHSLEVVAASVNVLFAGPTPPSSGSANEGDDSA